MKRESKTIEEIVETFIHDLKSTPEYKQAWKYCYSTNEILFNFNDLKFHNVINDNNNRHHINIVMDERLLLDNE